MKKLLFFCLFSAFACRFEKSHPLLSSSELPPQSQKAQDAQPTHGTATQTTPPKPLLGPFRWEKRATVPPGYSQVSDLESTEAGLLVVASTEALAQNGAALFSLSSRGELTELFRWTGQGFLRAHSYQNLVAIPDADAPFGLGFFVRFDVDGFVFFLDPKDPKKKLAKGVIPAVYHVFDTALLDGRLYASSGAYVPGDMPYRSPRAPAALFVEEKSDEPWRRVFEHPQTTQEVNTGVIRFTYLLPLSKGVLLAGVSDWNAGSYAVRIEGLPDAPTLTRIDGINGQTLRWGRFKEKLYHIAQTDFGTLLTSSTDGLHFTPVSGVSDPQDLVSFDDTLFLLAAGKLYQSKDGTSFSQVSEENASLLPQLSPLVSAPLEIFEGRLFAASPTTGEIFEAIPE